MFSQLSGVAGSSRPLPGEAGANLGLRLELGPRRIGDLIKAPGAIPAPYSYRLPVSHLVPAAAKVGTLWLGGEGGRRGRGALKHGQ